MSPLTSDKQKDPGLFGLVMLRPGCREFALHMIFHELATNACKHGALASASGRVQISWDQHLDGSDRKLAIHWSELNGPEVCEPKRKGFGLSLVTKALANAQVDLNFERTGLICRLLVEIDELPRHK